MKKITKEKTKNTKETFLKLNLQFPSWEIIIITIKNNFQVRFSTICIKILAPNCTCFNKHTKIVRRLYNVTIQP